MTSSFKALYKDAELVGFPNLTHPLGMRSCEI